MSTGPRKPQPCPIPSCEEKELPDGMLVCAGHYTLLPRASCLEIARYRSMVTVSKNARMKLMWSRRLRLAKERAILTAIDNSKPKVAMV